jgi:hypothetical protein
MAVVEAVVMVDAVVVDVSMTDNESGWVLPMSLVEVFLLLLLGATRWCV